MENPNHKGFITSANKIAQKSNCIRRSVGALIVQNEQIVASGWNGVAESYENCREAGCPRCINGGDTGSGYETCICIHAEQSAISDAAKRGVSINDSVMYVNLRPCLQCLSMVLASGITSVFYAGQEWEYSPEVEAIYQKLANQFDCFCRISELQKAELVNP